jgi:hypothetical protein
MCDQLGAVQARDDEGVLTLQALEKGIAEGEPALDQRLGVAAGRSAS